MTVLMIQKLYFDDVYDWRTDVQVFYYDWNEYDNRYDSKLFRDMEKGEFERCAYAEV